MQSSRLPRKLAAVLYADVAGYSRLMAENEDVTHRRLGEELDRIAAIVARHRGVVMHYAGDAVLAKFDAVVDALACAVELQRAIATRNAGLPIDRRLEFRIGVNLGDVIEDRGDVYGDGVNVAARVQSVAGPGEICISESVYTALGKKLPLVFEDLGPQTLKNIEKPVRVYRVLASGDWNPAADSTGVKPEREHASRGRAKSIAIYGAAALLAVALAVTVVSYLRHESVTASPDVSAPTAGSREASPAGGAQSTAAGPPSIAVLPFWNLSSDSEQDYFVDGLSEEILNSLAAIDDLRVTARTSSFFFKGKSEDLRSIAKILDVEYVLQGSVRRDGEQLLVTAQLINAATGYHLWSKRYERSRTDVFAIQQEISEAVAAALQITLGVGKIGGRTGMTLDVAAYDEYLLAHAAAVYSRSKVAHLVRAVDIDPSFMLAWVELANLYVMYLPVVDVPREEWSRKSAEALARARALAPEATEVIAFDAASAARRGEWLEAGKAWAQLEARGDANVAGGYGFFLYAAGQATAAIDRLEYAQASDPLSSDPVIGLAVAHISREDFRAANGAVERLAELGNPGAARLNRMLLALGTRDRAQVDRALALYEAEAAATDSTGQLFAEMGRLLDDPAAARDTITRMVEEPDNRSAWEITVLAIWAGYYGDPALALAAYERALAAGHDWTTMASIWSPALREMRTLPGFKTLVTKLGLVPYWREMDWSDFCSPVGDDDFECR